MNVVYNGLDDVNINKLEQGHLIIEYEVKAK